MCRGSGVYLVDSFDCADFPDPEPPIHDSLLLNGLLTGAGLMFVLGAVTLTVQRNLLVQCLGLGAMLLAGGVSFAAFGLFHGQRAGWLAAALVLLILLGHGWLAAGLLIQYRRERQTWEEDPSALPVTPVGTETAAVSVQLTVVSALPDELEGEEP